MKASQLVPASIAFVYSFAFSVHNATAAAAWQAKDLNPVAFKPAPKHAPVVLVKNNKAEASIVVMQNGAGAELLQSFIRQATGTELPIVRGKIEGAAIVLGDCPEAAALGLQGNQLPIEGFAIKTAPERVHIVGHNAGAFGKGMLWGVSEFLERYVGVRWYFPRATEEGAEIGQSVPESTGLSVPAIWLEDAPAFRKRELWPATSNPWNGSGIRMGPLHTFLRAGSSWPVSLKVHQPYWSRHMELVKGRPEVFQMREDGTRQSEVLCYGHPKTLETYLEGIRNAVAGKGKMYAPLSDKSITVSPADVELACYCEHCKKLWDKDGGQYGGASRVVAMFVDKLAREVKRRWPKEGFTIIYLPYLNYTAAPEGIKFPGNVEVQLCGMPGMAAYKEPAIRSAEQQNLERWVAISGRPVQNWHYCCWPAHKTQAAYQYPHAIQQFYQENRARVVGTFINGTHNHWPRQHISLYCWLKVLWDPEFNIDAAMDEFCRRMFGKAAGTMRQLLALQTEGWEKSRWPGGRFSPKGIYATSFPPKVVAQMRKLLAQAHAEAKADALTAARVAYYAPAVEAFFREADVMSGRGFKPLLAQKVGENPKVDGRFNEPVWRRVRGNSFVIATGGNKGKPARYATTVKAVWTTDGVTFGFHMDEPTPHLLETSNGGHDNGQMWWDDNVEIFVDVTGKSEGEFYQFIINPKNNLWDSKLKDTTWECKGIRVAAQRGLSNWRLEVFLPYTAFPEGRRPGSGKTTVWTGNFTRHRVADKGLDSKKPQIKGSAREYSRMNTTGSKTSDNLADFAEIRFVE